jgi:hypothetical protein
VTAPIAGRFSAGARQFRSGVIGSVGVQALFPCSRGETQRRSPCRYLYGFEIQVSDRLRT